MTPRRAARIQTRPRQTPRTFDGDALFLGNQIGWITPLSAYHTGKKITLYAFRLISSQRSGVREPWLNPSRPEVDGTDPQFPP